MATILVDRAYSTTFNTPRAPVRHRMIRRRSWTPLRHLWSPLQAVSFWNPSVPADLVHTFNTVPITPRPWIVSFESVMPRTLGRNHKPLTRILRERLLAANCKAVIGISRYAVRRTRSFLNGWHGLDEFLGKIQVIHPNVAVSAHEKPYQGSEELSILFVGNHFARKGGCVVLRMAQKARERKLPIRFQIVSSLLYGGNIYTDSPDQATYASDMKLLSLENITLHRQLQNAEVLKLAKKSHFVMLPTLHDTYGYSLLEAMAVGVPVIATNTAAIPENITHGENGYLLPLDVDAIGDWTHLNNRQCKEFARILSDTFENLADVSLRHIEGVLGRPAAWERLSRGAKEHILLKREAGAIGNAIEQVYDQALS